ncbi:MAG: carbohydrate porin [Acetobacteraceae bacterium]
MGLSFGLQDTNEIMGNVTGGVRRGAAYDGLTMASVGLDTDKAFGWPGGTINVSVLDIRGRSLSADNLMNLQTVSNISAAPAVRLWEMFFQQAFANGRFDVKIGQQSIDQEFITSQGSGVFLNTMMGWPMVPSADLYAGGPSYPLSSLGVRLRGRLTDSVTVLSGVFDDNPPGGSLLNDSQLRGAERTGTLFNLGTGALIIGEVQYALNQPLGQSGGASSALSGLYKLGFWYDTGRFVSQRYDTAGLSLADPRSTGTSATRWHNFSIYAVADQTVWQSDPQALGVFVRAMGAPGDRNLISFSANAGVTLKAPVPGRDNDVLGIGFGMTRISGAASGLDEDMNTFGQGPVPVRSSESFLELTYQAQVAPWWLFQPDFQYVFRPGAGLQDPNRPAQRIKDEAGTWRAERGDILKRPF